MQSLWGEKSWKKIYIALKEKKKFPSSIEWSS